VAISAAAEAAPIRPPSAGVVWDESPNSTGNSGGASPTSCFEVGGPGGGDKNTISAGWQASSAVRVNNANNTGTTRFPGYIGVPTADATLESFVEANNTMAAGDAFVTSSVAGISGGAACPL